MDQAAIRETLARAYAAGALDPALMLLVETQAALLPAQQRALRDAESVAGGLFENETESAMSSAMLARAFAAIDASRQDTSKSTPMIAGALGAELQPLPAPLRDAAFEAVARGARWGFAAPGVHLLTLIKHGAANVELSRIQPGAVVPRHTHQGEEYILVVAGAYHDGLARYRAGDVSITDERVTHRPVGTPGPTCYALSITTGGLKFVGLLGALQKLLPI